MGYLRKIFKKLDLCANTNTLPWAMIVILFFNSMRSGKGIVPKRGYRGLE